MPLSHLLPETRAVMGRFGVGTGGYFLVYPVPLGPFFPL